MAKIKRPTDINQRAKTIVDIATGQTKDNLTQEDIIKAAAAALGRKGGLKGGKARAKKLTAKRRSEIAKQGASARWGRKEE